MSQVPLTTQDPIFISYGRDDSTNEFVDRLHDDMEANGFNAWLDRRDIVLGTIWDIAIQQGLESCRGLLFIATKKVLTRTSVALNGVSC
jgi:hypothetical protein